MADTKITSYTSIAKSSVKEGVRDAIPVVLNNVVNQAKALLGGHVVSGFLRGSVMWKTKRAEGGFKSGNKLTTTVADLEGVAGSAMDYAVYTEYGTRDMDGFPWMRPAIAIVTAGAAFQSAVEKAMEATVKRKMKKV